MQRDSRIGPEHWSGCHKFSNIFFDGTRKPDGKTREGGLKMGGTYWYYYKLDDDFEFYNSAEPTTTQCPLLPGQLVNVLQVPYVFSGNRSRNTSVSSTSSEKRTLEPTDKYMNPRPVPKPKLHRLQTSPTIAPESWSSSAPSSSAPRSGWSATSGKSSAPSSAATLKMPLLSRKTSLDSHGRNQSPGTALAGSLKTAFRSFRSPRSASPEESYDNRIRTMEQALEAAQTTPRGPRSAQSHSRSLTTSRTTSREPSPSTHRGRQDWIEHDLAFRRRPTTGSEGSAESLSMSSFAEHRRQRSRSREHSSLRNSLALEDNVAAPLNDVADRKKQLSTVKEVASAQNTPGFPFNGLKAADLEKAAAALDLEKRLPTLPNTPSSAYPSSVTEIDPSTPFDIDQLQSHFSSTTIDTSSSSEPSSATDSARFSNFSSAYASTSRSSTCAESVIDEEPMSASLATEPRTPKTGRTDNTDIDDTPQPTSTFPPRDFNLATTISSSTISSTTASSLSTSPSEYNTDGGAWPVRSTSRDRLHYQHYHLPADDYGSEVTLKQTRTPTSREGSLPDVHHGFVNNNKPSFQQFLRDKPAPHPERQQHHHQLLPQGGPGAPPHSTSMQQLLNELSYLGDMIHR